MPTLGAGVGGTGPFAMLVSALVFVYYFEHFFLKWKANKSILYRHALPGIFIILFCVSAAIDWNEHHQSSSVGYTWIYLPISIAIGSMWVFDLARHYRACHPKSPSLAQLKKKLYVLHSSLDLAKQGNQRKTN